MGRELLLANSRFQDANLIDRFTAMNAMGVFIPIDLESEMLQPKPCDLIFERKPTSDARVKLGDARSALAFL